jgi:hypothetical protein
MLFFLFFNSSPQGRSSFSAGKDQKLLLIPREAVNFAPDI